MSDFSRGIARSAAQSVLDGSFDPEGGAEDRCEAWERVARMLARNVLRSLDAYEAEQATRGEIEREFCAALFDEILGRAEEGVFRGVDGEGVVARVLTGLAAAAFRKEEA